MKNMSVGTEEYNHWTLKTKVEETDETWLGIQWNSLIGLAFFLFTLIWKIKKISLFKVRAQCQEGRG